MGRLTKEGLDYFSLDCKLDDKIYMVEVELGLEGFALFIKLLMKVYDEGYYLKWDDRTAKIFAKQNNIKIDVCIKLIDVCINEGLFNHKLYKKYQILTSNGIQKRYFEAIKRRKEIHIIKEYLINGIEKYINSDKYPNNVYINSINDNINGIDVDKSTQSKVKESKVKESIEYIYSRWNEQKIIVHKNIDDYKSAIKIAIKKYGEGEVEQAIINYDIILKGKEYYFKYKWTLNDFLKRGIDKFLDLEIAKSNYLKGGKNNGTGKGYNNRYNKGSGKEGIDKYKHLEETYEV